MSNSNDSSNTLGPGSAAHLTSGSGASGTPSKRTSALSPMDPPQSADEIGRLGKYRILRVIGHGGMGVVYEAEDPQLKRRIAIKCLLAEVALREGNIERFLREARATAAVENEHVIPIHEVGMDDNVPFLVMPLLKGATLKHRLEAEKILPLQEVVRITREICLGLQAAHEKSLIHRDIKPENIWLDEKTGRVRILDFGLARVNNDLERSQGGHLIGTPGFIAPEQIAGEEVDERADLFSLGCLMYEMATGKPPFSGANVLLLLSNVNTQTPEDPRKLNPNLPDVLAELILKLLEKKKFNRPSKAQEVLDVLEPFGPLISYSAARSSSGSIPILNLDEAKPRAKSAAVVTTPFVDALQAAGIASPPVPTVRPAPPCAPPSPPVPRPVPARTPPSASETVDEIPTAPSSPEPNRLVPILVMIGLLVIFVGLVGLGVLLLTWNSGHGTPTTSSSTTVSPPSVIVPSVSPPSVIVPSVSPPSVIVPSVSPPSVTPPTVKKPTISEEFAAAVQAMRHPIKVPDYHQQYRVFERATDANFGPAWFYLGWCQFNGLGTKLNRIQAIQLLKQGDAVNDPMASFFLGLTECEGVAQPRNRSRGEARLQRHWASVQALADQDDPLAMVLLGEAYLDGYHVKQDREAAARLYKQAALLDEPAAMVYLATCYRQGYGVVQSDEQSLSLLKQAYAKQFPPSYMPYAETFRDKKLQPPDYEQAVKLFQQAADAGYALARLRQATTMMSLKTVDADLLKQAFDQARQELTPLAEAGDRRAQYDLGSTLIIRNLKPEDVAEGQHWLLKSAEQDYAPAQYQFGLILLKKAAEQGVAPTEALKWLRQAADQGHKSAESKLRELGIR